ncbi:hypothetical protein AMTR_s00119p00114820 [Amborella trichopoda]|uniref:Uncharacterized protein n=1 Tax=Amborella trichopoda TaxID=13333 RepID=W1NND9_AMBTC|nr:hypothetical protein AMTR_s00119p00114820 [Amborella trichopoda]
MPWLTHQERMMPDIKEDTDNELSLKEYKAWYNLVSHTIIHNIANPPKDILQPHNQEEEYVVLTHEPQYIMRPRGYRDQLFVPVDMDDVEAMMENLQCEYNDEGVPDEAGDDDVDESSRAMKDLALSTQPAVEEPIRYNTRKKQYQSKRMRPLK